MFNPDASWKLVTAPAIEPVTTAEAKAHLRVDISDDDTYIDTLIVAAREWAEGYTNRAFITQTWRASFPTFCNPIELRRPPLLSITGITYVDTAGATQTLATTVYSVDTDSAPGLVTLGYDQVWPSIQGGHNGVKVTYTAGYGATAASVPAKFKHAIKILVSHWYEIREPVIVGQSVSNVPMSAKHLLLQSRVWPL
jgi:uncharacterized phiE125 gp8 family phage protein